MVAPAKVQIQVRTPKETQGWTDAYHTLDFYAESDFLQERWLRPRVVMITIHVRGIYLPGFLKSSLHFRWSLWQNCGNAGRRFINAEDEEEEWRESAPGL